jgi:hypothetical protein
MEDTAKSLIAYCQENGRVCPSPRQWDRFWKSLPECRSVDRESEPEVPLILGAWHYASYLEKQLRFVSHIEWADKHGKLAEASTFLRGLEESEWHHFGD